MIYARFTTYKLQIKFIYVIGVHENSTMTSIDVNNKKKILFQ